MKQASTMRVATAAIGFGLIVLGLSTSTGQSRRSYEVETEVYGVPAYTTDAARAIRAYERLTERYMDLAERVLAGSAAQQDAVASRLGAIEDTLQRLDVRLARIEGYLGIPPIDAATTDPNASGAGGPGEPVPTPDAAPQP